jgi:hypothetical protein
MTGAVPAADDRRCQDGDSLLASVLEVARITIEFVFARGATPMSALTTSPHGDQPQPLIQGGRFFRGFATNETTAEDFDMKGLIAACMQSAYSG